MSLTSVTTTAGWIVGLAVLALVATGWRKPARATADPSRALIPRRERHGVAIEEHPTERYRRPSLLVRVRAALSTGVLSIIIGAVVATLASYGAAWLVIRLTDMLRS